MKRLLALFLSLVLMLGAVVPAYATGDGNFDGGGGGMGSGTSTNYWNPGMDGVRISVVNVDSHAVVGNTIDWSNQNPSTNMIHFGKVSKLSYNSGRALSPVVGGYTCIRPAQSLPRIISIRRLSSKYCGHSKLLYRRAGHSGDCRICGNRL